MTKLAGGAHSRLLGASPPSSCSPMSGLQYTERNRNHKQMPKKYNRGFYLHGFNYYCYNCVCSVCTKRKCSYSKGWGAYQYRCKYCEQTNGELGRLLECDFFENKHTSMRRFRIARRIHKKAPVMETLEKIQEQLAEMNLKLDK